MPGKRIDDSIKNRVIKDHSDGMLRKQISEKYGISVRSITRIVSGRSTIKKQEPSVVIKSESERHKKIEDLERRLELLEKRILDLDAKKR